MMRERAHAIGARMHVRSQVGQGTRVVILWKGTARASKETSAVHVEHRSQGRPTGEGNRR
jgi:hypothetical protein